jgi:hypothetical protein
VIVDELRSAVTKAPASRPRKRPAVSLPSAVCNPEPATAFKLAVISSRPNRNRARPPAIMANIGARFSSFDIRTKQACVGIGSGGLRSAVAVSYRKPHRRR